MKKSLTLALVALMCGVFFVADGFSFKLGNKDLVRIGSGNRTKLITLYNATLWAPAELKGKSGEAIVDADEPMAVRLRMISKRVTKDAFVGATSDGFKQAASSGYTTPQVAAFLKLFDNVEFSEGALVNMDYVPNKGLTVTFVAEGKRTNLGTIPGLQFKKALYAIWLGPKPVQGNLKNKMLGN